MEQQKSKYSKSLQRHIVTCPHCGADALDHMTQCKKCKGELEPRGYTPLFNSPGQKKAIKIVSTVFFVITAILLIALIIKNYL